MVDRPILVSVLLSIQLLSVLRKHLVTGQFSFSQFFIGHHKGSKFTGTDRNDRSRLCRPCIAAIIGLYIINIII